MKRSPLKRKPKSGRQKLILANDNLFREIIRIRDKFYQRPEPNLQVAHYWTRGNLRVRWDEDNAMLLTASRHIWWAHVHPEQFKEFWIKRLGQQRFDALELRARYVYPMKTFDLICINYTLEKQLKEANYEYTGQSGGDIR